MSNLTLNAEALYLELLRSMQQLIAASPTPPRLVGVASGGAWLAERLQKDLGLSDEIGVSSGRLRHHHAYRLLRICIRRVGGELQQCAEDRACDGSA